MSGSLLRQCFTVNQETCEMRVSSHLEDCVRNQRIKFMGQNKILEVEARQIESEIDSCVNTQYFTLSQSSFNARPACARFTHGKPVAAGAAAVRAKLQVQSFEDPLEEQRSIGDNYKLRLIGDIRKVRDFKAELVSRKACPGYRGKDLSGCFKQGLNAFTLTSSPQIVEMMVVATYAGVSDKESGLAKGRERMIDNLLSVLERADLQKFHLAKFNPAGEVDQETLAQLRKQDVEMLRTIVRKTSDTLSPYVGENGGRLSRQPASAVDFRDRLDFQLKREWEY
jgi:hypothetical protein